MGLKNNPQLSMRILLCRRNGCRNLLGMVGIVINNGKAVNLSLSLETTIRSGKTMQSLLDILKGNPQISCHRNGRQGIVDIVLSGNGKCHLASILSVLKEGKAGSCIMVIRNKIRRIIRVPMTEGNYLPSAQIL